MRFRPKVRKPASITLLHLLRRRKTTFDRWIVESGVNTYDSVVRWCDSVGVIPPSKEEWIIAFKPKETAKTVPQVAQVPQKEAIEGKPMAAKKKRTQVIPEAISQPAAASDGPVVHDKED
jgi:hypothetical protein